MHPTVDVTAASPSLISHDGVHLSLSHWPVPEPVGVIHALHGLGEHQGRFGPLATALQRQGWAVMGIDHRGHGRSDGPRGVVRSTDDLLHDQALAHDHIRACYPGRPLVMLGNSMGGLLAARFAAELGADTPARWQRPIDGLVMIAPALAPAVSAPQGATLSVLSRLVPDFALNVPFMQEWAHTDPAAMRAKIADPLIHSTITPRMFLFMLNSARDVFERLPRWQVPTLMLYASIDKLVSPGACDRFAREAPPHLLTSKAYDDMAHDLLHEPCQDDAITRISNWLGRFDSQ